jgi:hypothetical protein
MNGKKIVLVRIGFIIMFCALLGCDSFFATDIGKILENPRNYAGKTVTVSGEVTEVFAFLVIKYFIIRDKTGEIAVVTEKPLPKKGNRIKVKGTVEEAFAIGDKQLIVIIEKKE